MRPRFPTALALVPALLFSACVTTTASSTTWGEPYQAGWVRRGRVESIRETVVRRDGNPAAGAVAGAIVGGILGSAIGGHTRYDRWGNAYYHGSESGAVVGAVGGAMVGAAASQGSPPQHAYEVFVRFEDGGHEAFVFQGALPFQVGEAVSLTPQGLVRQ